MTAVVVGSAVHEAGHAVVASELGWGVSSVTIGRSNDPAVSAGGLTELVRPTNPDDLHYLAILLAGRFSQHTLLKDQTAWAVAGASNDDDRIAGVLRKNGWTRSRELRRARQLAISIIKRKRIHILSVAGLLAIRGSIGGDEFREVMALGEDELVMPNEVRDGAEG